MNDDSYRAYVGHRACCSKIEDLLVPQERRLLKLSKSMDTSFARAC